jgi:hypothetical protein
LAWRATKPKGDGFGNSLYPCPIGLDKQPSPRALDLAARQIYTHLGSTQC